MFSRFLCWSRRGVEMSSPVPQWPDCIHFEVPIASHHPRDSPKGAQRFLYAFDHSVIACGRIRMEALCAIHTDQVELGFSGPRDGGGCASRWGGLPEDCKGFAHQDAPVLALAGGCIPHSVPSQSGSKVLESLEVWVQFVVLLEQEDLGRGLEGSEEGFLAASDVDGDNGVAAVGPQ